MADALLLLIFQEPVRANNLSQSRYILYGETGRGDINPSNQPENRLHLSTSGQCF